MRFTPAADSIYLICVISHGGFPGEYQLRIEAGLAAPERQEIRAGDERTGTLSRRDATLEDGSPYHEYAYTGARGERLEVTLTSGEFDTFLMIGRMEAQPASKDADAASAEPFFVELARADAHPDDPARRSRLVLTLREAGDYIIRVNTFGPEQAGAYTLKVESIQSGRF